MNRYSHTIFVLLATFFFSQVAFSVTTLNATADLSNSHYLNKRVFGIHGELLWSPIRLGDPLLVKIYNDIGFQDIRLPGGAAGNLYLSQSEKFGCNKSKVNKAIKIRIKKFNESLTRKKRSYSTKDFLSFIKASKTNFTLIINVLCDTPDNTRKWMEQIRNSGVTVKYVEMGSEFYFKKYLWAFPTVSDYIKQAKEHAMVVRKVFPDVKIGLDTSGSSFRSKYFPNLLKMKEDERDRRGLMFDKLAASALFSDAFDIHIYSPLGTTRMDKVLDTIDNNRAYKNSIIYFDNRIKQSMQYLHKLNPNKKIWITEWGTAFYGWRRKHESKFLKSYYNALYVTNALLTYFSIPYIESTDYHNFPYLWSNFKKLEPNPLYYAMKFFKEPITRSTSVSSIRFVVIKLKTASHNHNYKVQNLDLNSMLFYNNTEGYLFIVNKFGRHYSLNSFSTDNEILDIQPYSYEQIIPDKNKGVNIEKINKTNIDKQNAVDIPPYSITKIYIKIKPANVSSKQVIQ